MGPRTFSSHIGTCSEMKYDGNEWPAESARALARSMDR